MSLEIFYFGGVGGLPVRAGGASRAAFGGSCTYMSSVMHVVLGAACATIHSALSDDPCRWL